MIKAYILLLAFLHPNGEPDFAASMEAGTIQDCYRLRAAVVQDLVRDGAGNFHAFCVPLPTEI